MKKLCMILTVLVGLALPKAAQSMDTEGAYAGGIVGANWVHFKGHDKVTKQKLRFDTGWVGGVHLGYRFCGGWRAEGEISYRYNEGKKHKKTSSANGDEGSSSSKHHGNLHTWSFMANGLYELPLCWCITPYVGAGIGFDVSEVSRKGKRVVTTSDEGTKTESKKKKEDGFAWQLIAGALYPIDDCLELGLEYRFHHGKTKDQFNNAVDVRLNWFF